MRGRMCALYVRNSKLRQPAKSTNHLHEGILSPLCAENNKVFNKTGALIILKSLLSVPLDADLLTEANASIIEAQDSIVEAETVRAAKGVEIEAGLK